MAIPDEKQWLKQANDDLKSAIVLLDAGRYTHCVFFCHLALEKALKAIYHQKFQKEPPKTHVLTALSNAVALEPPAAISSLITELATASIPTRYPDEMKGITRRYTKRNTTLILKQTKEALHWIKELLKKILKYLENELAPSGVIVTQFILFGSQAKGMATKDSDIDLIIVSESFRRKGFMKRVKMSAAAVGNTIRHFHVPIEVLLHTPEEIDNEYLEYIGAIVIAA